MELSKKTKRLTLRALKISDYQNWKNSIETQKWGKNQFDVRPGWAENTSKKSFQKRMKKIREGKKDERLTEFSVFRNDTKQWIGVVQIIFVNRGFLQSAIIGYYILNEHWGKGFGKEAVKAGLDIGFNKMKLHRLWAPIAPKNMRSQKLAKSVGMRREGLAKKLLKIEGQWKDHVVYAMTDDEI